MFFTVPRNKCELKNWRKLGSIPRIARHCKMLRTKWTPCCDRIPWAMESNPERSELFLSRRLEWFIGSRSRIIW